MTGQNLLIPSEKNWVDLMVHVKKTSEDDLLGLLNDLLIDDDLAVQSSLRPEDENIQFVRHSSSAVYKMFLGQTCFLASKKLMDVVFHGILLHKIFDVKYPSNFKNLAAFVMKLSGNDFLAEKLPNKAINNLKKHDIVLN